MIWRKIFSGPAPASADTFPDGLIQAIKNSMRLPLFLLAALACPALPAQAEAYKCRLPDGRIEFASQPCAGGKTVAVQPDETISEARRKEAEREVERMRNYVDKREAAQRAEDAAERERERNAARERAATPTVVPRHYSSADECLRDLAQTPLDAEQRGQMEADCRRIQPQQPVYVPVPVAVPARRPVIVVQPPTRHHQPNKPAPAPAPDMSRVVEIRK